MDMKSDVQQLLNGRREAQSMLRDAERQLTNILINFDGTLLDALKAGLVKPNFPTPPGFKRHLLDNY